MGIGVNLNTAKEFYANQGHIEASSVLAETGKRINVEEFKWALTEKLI